VPFIRLSLPIEIDTPCSKRAGSSCSSRPVRLRAPRSVSCVSSALAVRPRLHRMFERFTDRARRVVVFAQEEARMLNHDYIGTEHILLGLIHEGEGVAAKVLESLNISLEAVRQQVEEIIGRPSQPPAGHIPFTPRAKKVLELSLREALQLGHNYIGTEHILLGLIREREGVADQVLERLGASLERTRLTVLAVLEGKPLPTEAELTDRLVRAVAETHGLTPDTIEQVRTILALPADEEFRRLSDVVSLADTFGLDVVELARFVREKSSDPQ